MKTKKMSGVVVGGQGKPMKEGVDDDEEQLRIVNLVCDAVDYEVESRSTAVVAIGDAHMASAATQLQLMMSKFSEHIRKMTMGKFVKEHCSNTKASTRSDGALCFHLGGGIFDVSIGFSSVQNTPGFELSQASSRCLKMMLPSFKTGKQSA